MAKRSRELGMRLEKNRGGCLWSLVSKVYPRNGRSIQKLLLDNGSDGHGISRSNSDLMTMHNANVRDNPDSERTELIAISGKPSIKTLMEEEMINEASADSRQNKYQSTRSDGCNEQSSSDDVRDILEYLGSLFPQRSAICREHDEEKFSRGLRKVLSQRHSNGRQLTEDEKLRRSKVFVDMLQILNSAKFSLLNPEVTLKKCVEILHESHLGRSSSGEEEGDLSKMNVESSSVSKRIVILKPGMTELRKSGKVLNVGVSREIKTIGPKGQKTILGAPNFLSDIKRKLQNVVAKDYSDLTADSKDSYPRKATKRAGIKVEDASKHEPARVSNQTRKYLSEAITDEDEDMSYPGRNSEIMGMILVYPKLNCSPCASPGRRKEHGAVNSPSRFSVRSKSQSFCDKRRKPESTQRKETDMYAFRFLGENVASSAAEGDLASPKLVLDLSEESGPGILSSYGNGSAHDMKKECREREQLPSRQFPSSEMSLIIEKGDEDDLGVAIDLPERPSPISVFQPPISDDISPAVVKRVEVLRQDLEIELEEDDIRIAEVDDLVRTIEEDKESVSDQVRALLQSSDLKWDDLYLKSQNSDQLIEPFLLHDQHFFKDNAKLLVDCVNEALLEAYACFFGRSCLYLVKQRIKPVPSLDFTIHEACRIVKWHLNPIPLPHSLEQIVGKDLSRRGSWLNLTFEGEGIVFEVCESIFSGLLRDLIVSSVDEFTEGSWQLKNRRPS